MILLDARNFPTFSELLHGKNVHGTVVQSSTVDELCRPISPYSTIQRALILIKLSLVKICLDLTMKKISFSKKVFS